MSRLGKSPNKSMLVSEKYSRGSPRTKSVSFRQTFDVSRSSNPKYSNLSKLQDVTRKNSTSFNVSHYQDYPNRKGTPIPIPSKTTSKASPTKTTPRNISTKANYVKSLIFSPEVNFSQRHKKMLYYRAVNAPLRPVSIGPIIANHGTNKIGFVMNDFHLRETNPGFARNKAGGYYTR